VPAGARFVFGPFELDPARRRLTCSGERIALSDRQLEILSLLVARAGQIVAKDDLLAAGWKDVAVGDNSLEQAISILRKLLGARHIETVARRGYHFGVAVERRASRESDAGLEALLAPHRAFIEGRAALESLEGVQVARARSVFEGVLRSVPDLASAHVGLANACVMQFETTRADPAPDTAALEIAAHHAREACRFDPRSGEAWATLGFVLDRTGDRADALAASKRAVALEPDNWRHHFRLSFVGWGEERLQAAQRTLALLPHFPLAHWLAATVHIARGALGEAERELIAALAVPAGQAKFTSVALHWLLGLILLARGDEARALQAFEQELSSEHAGHLYSREISANSWYAIGALKLRQRRAAEAGVAFEHVVERVATHPMARAGLAAVNARHSSSFVLPAPDAGAGTDGHAPSIEASLVRAAYLKLSGSHVEAARIVETAMAGAAPGNAGWLLPVEPLLHVTARPDVWARALAHLRNRAS
jgi:DNA-binding winged helix-turn-helix (wHTH) protein